MLNLDKESAKLLKVDELKAALKARRCSISGKKADLYDRLVAFLEDEVSTQANEASISSEEESKHVDAKSSGVADMVKSTDDTDPATEEPLSETKESVAITGTSHTEDGVSTEPAARTENTETAPSQESHPAEDHRSADNSQNTGSNEISPSSEIAESSVALPSLVEETAVAVESSVVPEKIVSESTPPLQVAAITHIEEKSSKLSEKEVTNVKINEIPKIHPAPEEAATVKESSISTNTKEIAVETEEVNTEVVMSVVDDAPSGAEFHVRIDNFQRPLTDKLLFEWLARVLGHEVAKEKLWMNKIKTHCYIDFDTLQLADACIAAVTGQKVDDKHSLHLVAASTDVCSKDAENSIEGKLKPNEWKNSKMQKFSGSESSAGLGNQHGIPPKIPAVSMATGSIDMIKKAAYSATNSLTKVALPNQNISSESIQGNIQVGFSTKRNSSGAGLMNEISKRPNLGADPNSFEITRKEDAPRVIQNQEFNDTVELDTLFRKTVTLPPLYWLPVPDHIVELRKNSH